MVVKVVEIAFCLALVANVDARVLTVTRTTKITSRMLINHSLHSFGELGTLRQLGAYATPIEVILTLIAFSIYRQVLLCAQAIVTILRICDPTTSCITGTFAILGENSHMLIYIANCAASGRSAFYARTWTFLTLSSRDLLVQEIA